MNQSLFSSYFTCNSVEIIIVVLTAGQVVQVMTTDIGVVYSPLIRSGDQLTTQAYTRDIIKVMLNVILDSGAYNATTTYGVGCPNRSYDNQSISDCSSFVHTAMAAAEINKNRNHLALTLYQGVYNSPYMDQLGCEIEVGLEIAGQANRLYEGTVSAIVYPSQANFNDLVADHFLNGMIKNVSGRAHAVNLKYGMRVLDCQNIPTNDWMKVKDVMLHCDFVICLKNPDSGDFKFGSESFKNAAILTILQLEEYLENKVNISRKSLEVILETGWPGDPSVGPPNSVQDQTDYWNSVTEWAIINERRVFLHEAFDAPWKDVHLKLPLASHFGKWENNVKEPNLLSKNAYILKLDPSSARTFFSSFGSQQIGILAGAVLFTLIAMITLLYLRVRRVEGTATATINLLNEQDIRIFFEGVKEEDGHYSGGFWEKSPYNDSFEINKNQIKIEQCDSGLLGKGQFGCVYRGEFLTSGAWENVAVKMTHPYCPESAMKCLLSEIKILTYVGSHANICSLLGAYTKEISKGTVYFAMELCELGNLGSYLQKNKPQFEMELKTTNENVYITYTKNDTFKISIMQLVRWSYEVASAMNFISSKNVIHSDLAARNVLLTTEYTSKVTDFGLSRRFQEGEPDYAKSGTEPLPWKWLAPESLESKKFNVQSDVYSYGITLWEIFSLGSSPRYESVCNWNDLITYLKTGKRLEQPQFASDAVYQMMIECWSWESANRPSFAQLLQSLVSIIDNDYKDLTELE